MNKIFYFILFVLLFMPKLDVANADYSNFAIANIAVEHNNYTGYTCKEFVYHIINDHLNGSLGTGYRDCYLNEGSRIEIFDESKVSRGDIIQISYDPDPTQETHVHSAIALNNLGNGYFDVVHSNWCSTNTVCITTNINFTEDWIEWAGWSVHYYRLGQCPLVGNYTFPSESSEGWTEGNNVTFMCGGDANSLYMNITGTNPGIVSPEIGPEVYADDVVIQFRAKVTGMSPATPIMVYVKDQNDSWANSVTLETVSDPNYHYYVAYLSEIANASLKIVKQFSIELTEGSTDGYEYWEFDEVKVVYIGEPLLISSSNFSDFKGTLQLNDMNGNGKDEIGILKRHSVIHQPTVTIYDSYTGVELTEIYFFDSRIVPQYVLKLPDANSNSYPEIRVFGYENHPFNTVSETRDGKSGALIE